MVTAIKVLNVYGSVLEDLYSKEVSFMSFEASLISCKAGLLSSSASLTYIFDFSLQSKRGESIFQLRKSLATFFCGGAPYGPLNDSDNVGERVTSRV